MLVRQTERAFLVGRKRRYLPIVRTLEIARIRKE